MAVTPEDPFIYFTLEEELDTQPAVERHKPPSIDVLFEKTKFSRSEIQYLYRTFKEVWPNGTVELVQFQSIYADIFPEGNSKPYAELVFRNIDQSRTGSITFLDFVTSFSKIAKGTLEEKLDWIFSLYDSNCVGYIGYQDIYNVVKSMYQLVDATLKPAVIATICRQHVKIVFKNLQIQQGGRVSRQEFFEKCQQNSEIMESFSMFGTLMKMQ
ncbi:unnamed protein product [Caenorhabditis angaria]|uniref:EF-hand domain-containing protein n=1 Tax=Caenorhabditis angaria TaxID=860376 RepID=A0A9P1J0K3_9PELO|nr:unnamed protein product [Caenorhabditis angaria]